MKQYAAIQHVGRETHMMANYANALSTAELTMVGCSVFGIFMLVVFETTQSAIMVLSFFCFIAAGAALTLVNAEVTRAYADGARLVADVDANPFIAKSEATTAHRVFCMPPMSGNFIEHTMKTPAACFGIFFCLYAYAVYAAYGSSFCFTLPSNNGSHVKVTSLLSASHYTVLMGAYFALFAAVLQLEQRRRVIAASAASVSGA